MTGGPRKLTGRRVWRAVLKQPRFRLVQKHVPSLSLSAVRVVLLEVCAAIAESEELGVYRLEAGGDSFPRALEMRLGFYDGAEAIAADLAALVRRGLVLEVEGGLSVPVDWDAVRGVQAAAVEAGKELEPSHQQRVEAGKRGGRPPDPNSERQRKLRLLGEVQGGRSGYDPGSDPGSDHNRTHNRAGSDPGYDPGSDPGSDGAYSPIEVLTSTATDSESVDSLESVAVEVGTYSLEAESRARSGDAGAPVMIRTGDITGDGTGDGISGPIAAALAELAADPVELAGLSPDLFSGAHGVRRLGVLALQLAGLDERRNRNAEALAAEWLQRGHSPAVILQTAREVRPENKRRLQAGRPPVDHLRWIEGRLTKAAAGPGAAVQGGPMPPSAPPPSIPRELERPWMTDRGRLLLGAALRALDGADRAAAGRAVARLLRADQRFAEVVRAARPAWAAEAAA